MSRIGQIRDRIRSVPDFPKKGILFRDISPVLADARTFRVAVEDMARPVRSSCEYFAAVESRGFIFGSAVADISGKGLVLLRKPGKLPPPVIRKDYTLEYGNDSLEIQADVMPKGSKVVLVDDVLATGGTAKASIELLRESGMEVTGAIFLIDLPFLGGSDKLSAMGIKVHSVVSYGAGEP